jgi:demethylmenaquinone methyltransferase/2-methoxy-6-polyprenyl-1,4-benzoquinol methylase
MRHVEIEQDDIRLPLQKYPKSLSGIGRTFDLKSARELQHPLQKTHVGRLIVHDEKPGFLKSWVTHGSENRAGRRPKRDFNALSFARFLANYSGMSLDGSIQAQSVRAYFARIAHRYDLANHLLSLGIDVLWRIRAAEIVKRWKPKCILDLATGSGDLARTLRRACPDAFLVGADFCEPMLRVAQPKGLPHLVVADAHQLPFADASFDVVTVAFGLRNMASWSGALAEISRVLVPGGHLLILDFGLPAEPLRTPYRFYLHRILPNLAAVLTGERSAYDYLADSIEAFPNGTTMCERLEENGYRETAFVPLLGGVAALYIAKRP